MTAEYELDVLVPVYNEGQNIRRTLNVLFQSNRVPFRVHICYDRDDDNTLQELEKFPDALRERIHLIKNEGKGAHGAICTGFRRSTAPAVVVYPADDDYNPGVLDLMFHKWKDEGCEIVAASRFIPGGCMVGCPWLKATLVRCAAFTLYHLAGLPTHDPSNGFRLFSRRVLDRFEIESTAGFVYSIELLGEDPSGRLEDRRSAGPVAGADPGIESLPGHEMASGLPALVFLCLCNELLRPQADERYQAKIVTPVVNDERLPNRAHTRLR